MSMPNFSLDDWITALLGRGLRAIRGAREKSHQGNPSRFDAEFPLHIQMAAVRGAEAKRARRARIRRLNRA